MPGVAGQLPPTIPRLVGVLTCRPVVYVDATFKVGRVRLDDIDVVVGCRRLPVPARSIVPCCNTGLEPGCSDLCPGR